MEPRKKDRVVILGVPVSALAALPLCPACYPAYAGVLSALGLGAFADTASQTALTLVFVAAALGGLWYKAASRRGYGPLALGAGATAVLGLSKFVVGSDPLIYAAVAGLVAAGVWNSWPRAEAACPAGLDATPSSQG